MSRAAVAGLAALGLWGAAAAAAAAACPAGGCEAIGTRSLALLQLNRQSAAAARAAPAAAAAAKRPGGQGFSLAGKSVYFLLTDRFARSDGDDAPCHGGGWCNGTLRGVTEHLDYIQGMGFDCVWITPVVKQFEGNDDTGTPLQNTAFHGYWAYDWYQIDPHFGTEEDLRDLSDGLHERGMCFILDMVVNHVGPILSSKDVAKVRPFNQTSHYNQPGATQGMSFDDYTRCFREFRMVSPECPYPLQALGKEAFGEPVPADLPFCGVGSYCQGYDEALTQDGWFYDLGDLNQSVPFVREGLIDWAVHMVEAYEVDAIRLDTASFVPRDFLAELQESVGVEILGEVSTTNQTYHASFQLQKGGDEDAEDGEGGLPVLDGLLNFPLGVVAPFCFCGALPPTPGGIGISEGLTYPFAMMNLTRLGEAMSQQLSSGAYRDMELLGNFADNHDTGFRISLICKGHPSRLTNALAWVMFARGIPIIYYGTEQDMASPEDARGSLWQTGFDTTAGLYRFLAEMNRVRRRFNLGGSDSAVVFADEQHLVFIRGGPLGAWVYLNNLAETSEDVVYEGVVPPPAPPGKIWADALGTWQSGALEPAQFSGGDFVASGSTPKVLVLVDAADVAGPTASIAATIARG